MSAFPNWQQHVVKQRRNQTGCIENCKAFVAEVFATVPPNSERLSSAKRKRLDAMPQSGGGESLVVGIKFHRGHVDGIVQGESVQLVREPNNAHDPNAVRVNLQTRETLGYLTREFAAALAKQMDAGIRVQSQVSRTVRDKVYVAVVVGKLGI